jgi:hypothetical protein
MQHCQCRLGSRFCCPPTATVRLAAGSIARMLCHQYTTRNKLCQQQSLGFRWQFLMQITVKHCTLAAMSKATLYRIVSVFPGDKHAVRSSLQQEWVDHGVSNLLVRNGWAEPGIIGQPLSTSHALIPAGNGVSEIDGCTKERHLSLLQTR